MFLLLSLSPQTSAPVSPSFLEIEAGPPPPRPPESSAQLLTYLSWCEGDSGVTMWELCIEKVGQCRMKHFGTLEHADLKSNPGTWDVVFSQGQFPAVPGISMLLESLHPLVVGPGRSS